MEDGLCLIDRYVLSQGQVCNFDLLTLKWMRSSSFHDESGCEVWWLGHEPVSLYQCPLCVTLNVFPSNLLGVILIPKQIWWCQVKREITWCWETVYLYIIVQYARPLTLIPKWIGTILIWWVCMLSTVTPGESLETNPSTDGWLNNLATPV